MRWAWRIGHVAGNGVVGAAAGVSWPFVYFMGYAISARLGWIVDDPTVTKDGVGLLIGLGVLVLVVVASAFGTVNVVIAHHVQRPAMRLLPTGFVVGLVVAALVSIGLYH